MSAFLKFERRYLQRLQGRHIRPAWIWFKLLVIVPIYYIVCIPVYYIVVVCVNIIKKPIEKLANIRIKRRHKPDIILSNIAAGWAGLAFKNKAIEELALKRAAICATCPFAVADKSLHTIVVDNRTKNIRGMRCTKCGCPLSAKIRAINDHCPIGHW